MEREQRKRRWLPVLLVVLPLWLVVSGGVGLWLGFRNDREQARLEQARHARNVDAASMADDVRKLVEVVGRRDTSDEAGRRGLSRAAVMIEGALGAGNAGYPVVKSAGPETGGGSWPMLEVATGGEERPALWVVAAYDTRGGGVEANSTGVAAVLAAARALAGAGVRRELRVALVPHGFAAGGPARQGAELLRERIRSQGGALQVLCVESMGAGEDLWLSGRDPESPAFRAVAGLGKVVGAGDAGLDDGFDLATCLAELGVPAVRVATRGRVAAEDSARAIPEQRVLAAAAGRLVELARRLAGGEAK